tara:strand:- start:707 stop:1471 length:765 start_codon:yes stop_codon:yes gene_type:complete
VGDFLKNLRLALSFLTRLPGGIHPANQSDLGSSVPWFPVIGVLIGLISGSFFWVLILFMPPLVASVLAIGFSILVTGAFHEDGLADTFDSFGAFNAERRLEIMKDSRIGTFGTLALLINVTLSVGALTSLEGEEGFLAIILAHTLSRVASIIVLTTVKPAKQEGLGVSYSLFSSRLKVILVASFFVLLSSSVGLFGLISSVAILLIAFCSKSIAVSKFGGTTGDFLGAVQQIANATVLVIASATFSNEIALWLI